MKISQKNTQLNTQDVAKFLSQFAPGKVPTVIWNEEIKHLGSRNIELIPLRKVGKKYEVYMFPRPTNDHWSNMYGCPGITLNGPELQAHAFTRLKKEFEKGIVLTKPIEFAHEIVRPTLRATESAFFYVTLVKSKNNKNFFDTENLPKNIIPHHRKMIQMAVKFLKSKDLKKQKLS